MSDATFDPMVFRNALGTFTTGVTVITARGSDGNPVGVTANSFNSVSLDPPLVLWSLAKTSGSLPVFEEAEYFAVHILSNEQQDLSNRFAGRGQDKFKDLDVPNGLGKTPLLADCCARMQCKTAYRYEGGDHIIFVGEVIDLEHSNATPLVFQAGKYALASRKVDETPLLSSENDQNSAFSEDYLGYLLWRAYFQFHTMARKQASIAAYSDLEFLVLVTLFHSSERSGDDLTAAMSYEGSVQDTASAIENLVAQELVQPLGTKSRLKFSLTEQGREKTLGILAAAKSTESEFLNKLGMWESVALKNLLKQFITETDPGLPHLWETAANSD